MTLKDRVVEDWKAAHKWLTMQIAAAGACLDLAYTYLPDFQRFVSPYIPPHAFAYFCAAIMAVRIVRQTPKKDGEQ